MTGSVGRASGSSEDSRGSPRQERARLRSRGRRWWRRLPRSGRPPAGWRPGPWRVAAAISQSRVATTMADPRASIASTSSPFGWASTPVCIRILCGQDWVGSAEAHCPSLKGRPYAARTGDEPPGTTPASSAGDPGTTARTTGCHTSSTTAVVGPSSPRRRSQPALVAASRAMSNRATQVAVDGSNGSWHDPSDPG